LFCYYPCPCGWFGDPVKECTCSHAMVSRYQKRISGPLLDRIDIHIEVPRVEYEKLSDDRLGKRGPAYSIKRPFLLSCKGGLLC
jgi:magnesium chelatase family protein